MMGTLLCRGGSGGGGQHVVGEDEVGLQREMGLVSGISLIVGEPVFFKSSPSLTFSTWPGTIVGSGIWQTAGSLMYNSGYTAQQFECTQFIAQKMFIALPIGPWGFLSFSMSNLESS